MSVSLTGSFISCIVYNKFLVCETCPRTMVACPCMFARFPSCGIFTPTRAIPVKITSCNNRVTVPVTPQERQITSCMARGGQHARPPHKHCKAYLGTDLRVLKVLLSACMINPMYYCTTYYILHVPVITGSVI